MTVQTHLDSLRQGRLTLPILLLVLILGTLRAESMLAMPSDEISIYDDSLATGWQEWSWDTMVDPTVTAPVQEGAIAIAVTYTAAWGGFYLHADPPVSTAGLSHLRFWVHGGPVGGQKLAVKLNGEEMNTASVVADAGLWRRVDLPLSDLGSPATIGDLYWQDAIGGPQATFYLDSIALISVAPQADLPDATADRVLGQSLLTSNGYGSALDQLHGPAGLAIAPDGRLFVADYDNHRVLSWASAADFVSGQSAAFSLGGNGDGRNQLAHPESVAVDKSGNLYIADTDNHRVAIYRAPVKPGDADVIFGEADPDGCFVAMNNATAIDFCYPRGLAFDTAGHLYVVDEYHHRIKVYSPPFIDGMAATAVLGQSDLTTGWSNTLSGPRGIAIDALDRVYVADSENNRVVEYDSPLTTDRDMDHWHKVLMFPIDLALDGSGRLYVSELGNDRVVVYPQPHYNDTLSDTVYGGQALDGTCDDSPDPAGIAANAATLHCPLGLAVDPAGALYVADFDNNRVLAFDAPPTPLPGDPIVLNVDVAAERKPISEQIYGLHYTADKDFAREIRLPVRRWGGNDTTRYNWRNNMFGNVDWYFENEVMGLSADEFIARDRRTGTSTLITVPMIGWVANDPGTPGDSSTYPCSFDTRKYVYQPLPYPWGEKPASDPDDPNRPHCGSGIRGYENGDQDQPIYFTGNDPHDTSMSIGPDFVATWIEHLKSTFGAASAGGVRLYNLDNEPDLWHETHRDVFPQGLTYDQFLARIIAYGAAVKASDPGAQTLGPAVHGWTYYWHSPADGQRKLWEERPDRMAHGDVPLVPWLLQQLEAYEQTHGQRLLDYLDLHFYPQNGVDLRDAGDGALQALRLRSTRALWDPTYVDESWIANAGPDDGIVQLIPRMRTWIDQYYPGTKLAITEYNWGGLEHINGALTQADILGIFGSEGLDLATLFDTPYSDGGTFTPDSPGAFAFRIYRNYNGAGDRFGDVSVGATSSDRSQLAIYAASRTSDGVLTIVVINKTGKALPAALTISNHKFSGPAMLYRYDVANLDAIIRLPDLQIDEAGNELAFPAESISLLVISGDPLTSFSVYLPMISR